MLQQVSGRLEWAGQWEAVVSGRQLYRLGLLTCAIFYFSDRIYTYTVCHNRTKCG
jgi:hypothetical protein